jgi:hypothetical protein
LVLTVLAFLCLPWVGGCGSTVTLDRAVMAYDAATTKSLTEQLLLNIARARHNQPMHFTGISSIAATYRFGMNGGVAPAATGDRGFLIVPFLGGAAEENPTISIAPMQGEEFTQRLLTPFEERKLTLLLRQGYDVDALLRLMGAEIRIDNGDPAGMTVNHNRPTDWKGYPVYRRIMAHLSAIQDRHALHVEPLHFQHTWTVAADAVTPESYESTYKQFSLTYDAAENVYRVTRRVNGRVMITNYDPGVLSNEARLKLHEEAEQAPYNDVLIDIRRGYPGGEWPVHGRLRLRSFHEVLTFIGRGIVEEPEYNVSPDPRSPPIQENPPRTLDIVELRELPRDTTFSVRLHGLHYAVRPNAGYQWNRKAFSLLYQLFQMTVSSVPDNGPAITIAK